jgi:hypothetical protein
MLISVGFVLIPMVFWRILLVSIFFLGFWRILWISVVFRRISMGFWRTFVDLWFLWICQTGGRFGKYVSSLVKLSRSQSVWLGQAAKPEAFDISSDSDESEVLNGQAYSKI